MKEIIITKTKLSSKINKDKSVSLVELAKTSKRAKIALELNKKYNKPFDLS